MRLRKKKLKPFSHVTSFLYIKSYPRFRFMIPAIIAISLTRNTETISYEGDVGRYHARTIRSFIELNEMKIIPTMHSLDKCWQRMNFKYDFFLNEEKNRFLFLHRRRQGKYQTLFYSRLFKFNEMTHRVTSISMIYQYYYLSD